MKWMLMFFLILFFIACDNNVEEKKCIDNCQYAGEIICNGNTLKTCIAQSNGCLKYKTIKTCEEGKSCNELTNQCESDNCENNEHKEDGGCISNTKQVPCKDVAPENGESKIINVDVDWDSETSTWNEVAECTWSCNVNFHKEENICVKNDCKEDFDCNPNNNKCISATCKANKCIVKSLSDVPCDDKEFCSVSDTCKDGVCVGVVNTCDDNNDGTIDSCDEENDTCINTIKTGSCDDGLFCTIDDTYNSLGVCVGVVNTCDDNNDGTIDSCDEENNTCINTIRTGSCDDGLFCTINDAYNSLGVCIGVKNICDDNNDGTIDSCDEENNTCINTIRTGACNDGQNCTINDTYDSLGVCVGVVKACDDGLSCTTNSCDESTGDCVLSINDGKCLIDEICYDNGDLNSTNNCLECNASPNFQSNWSQRAPETSCGLNASCQSLGTDFTCQCNEEDYYNYNNNCCPLDSYYESGTCVEACTYPKPDIITSRTNNQIASNAFELLFHNNIANINKLNNYTAVNGDCGNFVDDWYKITLEAGTYATIKVKTKCLCDDDHYCTDTCWCDNDCTGRRKNDAVLELFTDSDTTPKVKVDFYAVGTESMIIGEAGTFYIKVSDYVKGDDGDNETSLLLYSLNIEIKSTIRTDNFLYVYGSKQEWEDARNDCPSSSNLVKIETEEENRIIKEFITAHTWIGLNDREDDAYCNGQSSNWKWSVDGTTLGNYKNWSSGEPNNDDWRCSKPRLDSNQDCVVMFKNGKWDDLQCSEERRFICEF